MRDSYLILQSMMVKFVSLFISKRYYAKKVDRMGNVNCMKTFRPTFILADILTENLRQKD